MKKHYILPKDIFPVVVGFSHSSNKKAVELAKLKRYPFVLGIAPQTAIKSNLSYLDEWIEFIRKNKPNAIGEVGLDYKWAINKEDVEKERMVFSKMIALADELELPLVIHARNNPNENKVPKNAIEEIINMVNGRKVLMHFFSGNVEQAERIVTGGGYLSFTYIHSKEKRKVINTMPLDRILVESDAPYVGKTPDSIREAIAYIAEVKGIKTEEVAKATAKNAMEFFGFRL